MNNQPAFPQPKLVQQATSFENEDGMTLRDYFAAKAMQSLMWDKDLNLDTKEDVAEVAYAYAEAMMKARES